MSRNVYVADSAIAGRGVFARKSFKKGETVFILKGTLKHWVVKDKETSAEGPNWIGIGHQLWLDPAEPYMYLNHSCDPNMGIRGRVTFVALRDICKGEEVTFDYATTEDDMLWSLPFRCGCKSRHCRGDIRSIQSLPAQTYNRYLPYVPRYFQRVYARHHALKP